MTQRDAWEREYRNPQLITLGDEPQKDLKKFLKFLRRKEQVELSGLRILDLGSGNGKNTLFLAAMGNRVTGIEFSPTAIRMARERAKTDGIAAEFIEASFGDPLPFPDASFDLILDVMSSNALNEAERETCLRECVRVLKPGGHMFVRTLCKDGDKNANNLLKMSPGPEHDTYINTAMDLTERVFSETDFRKMYSAYFTVLTLDKKTNYARFGSQLYKRNYWLAALKRPV